MYSLSPPSFLQQTAADSSNCFKALLDCALHEIQTLDYFPTDTTSSNIQRSNQVNAVVIDKIPRTNSHDVQSKAPENRSENDPFVIKFRKKRKGVAIRLDAQASKRWKNLMKTFPSMKPKRIQALFESFLKNSHQEPNDSLQKPGTGDWTEKEDEKILQLAEEYKKKDVYLETKKISWQEISKSFDNRSNKKLKRRYQSLIKELTKNKNL